MLKINFKTDKGQSTVWIPRELILQIARNKGTYKEVENDVEVEKEIDFLNVTLKEKMKVPISPNGSKKSTREENIIYTITDIEEIERVISQL